MKALLWLIALFIRAILVYGAGIIIALLLPLYVTIEYFKPLLDITYGNDVVGTPSTNFIVFVLSLVCAYVVMSPVIYLFVRIYNYLDPKYQKVIESIYKP